MQAHALCSPSVQSEIALAAHAGRQSLERIAEDYGVSVEHVVQWRDRLQQKAVDLFDVSSPGQIPTDARGGHEIKWETVNDTLDMCIAVLGGSELRYKYVNKAYRALAPQVPMLGKRLHDVFPSAQTYGVEDQLLKVLETGVSLHISEFAAPVAGQPDAVWECHATRVPSVCGDSTATVVVQIRNVTSDANRDKAIRQDVALLRAISETSTDVIYAKDMAGRLRFANPATLSLIGKSLDQVLGFTDAQFLEDKDAARQVMENDRRIMESGNGEALEERVPLPDGSERIWWSEKCPYRDDAGNVIGLLGISRDITDRVRDEKRTQAAHVTLQRVLDSISDGLAILDRDWHYTYFSQTGADILNLRVDDMLGRRVWDLFPHADSSLYGREYRRAMETGVATHFEEYYPEPLNVWLECHCYPFEDGLSVYFRDVTDRHLAKRALEENERRLEALFEATPVGLAYANAQGHLLKMNAECRRIWGEPPESEKADEYAEWKGWWGDGSERQGQRIGAYDWPMARALSGEKVVDAIAEIEPFDGPGMRRTLMLRSVPVKNSDGQTTGAVTAQMDITDTVKAKEAVQESSRQLKQLANTIPQLAWMADETGFIHWYNDRWYDYTGTMQDDMQGWGWQIVHHPEELPKVMAAWQHSINAGVAFEMTFPLRGKDGVFRPFYTLVEPLKDASGRVMQWFGTNTDVSSLHDTQNALHKTQQWLQEGLEAGRMVAWEWDFAKAHIKYSANALQVIGFDSDSVEVAWDSVHEEDRVLLKKVIDDTILAKGSFDLLTRRTRLDTGEMIWIETRGRVMTDQTGIAVSLRGILIDVTQHIRHQQEMEDSSRRKDEFLAMLAHELRNPLAPITTAAQLLNMTHADPQRVKSAAAIISRQVSHMANLIDDLLDVSRVTRGLIQLEKDTINLKEVINYAIEQASPLIEARQHDLTLHITPTPVFIVGDRVRLAQVVVNLLNNAAKYTPQGGKIILDIGADAHDVHISVSDNGIGIDAKLLPHVFELFTQATRTADRSQGGLGLGLALVESLVKMHGGKVAAYSDGIGKGSRFVVTLPIEAVSDKDDQNDNEMVSVEDAKTLSILVVDDNIDAAHMLSAVLELEGHQVTMVDRPSAAIEAARDRYFDVIVLDIGLPEMDGYQLAQRLRTLPTSSKSMFVALTGYGQAQDKALSKSAGFSFHLVKPINLGQLNAILKSIGSTISPPPHLR